MLNRKLTLGKGLVLGFVFLLQTGASWAGKPPVNSLNDLPKIWNGIAGDLFSQSEGSLIIERILKVSREEKADGFVATYYVEGKLTLGARQIGIEEVELSVSKAYPNAVWMKLQLRDALVPKLWASATYEEATNEFTLKEMPRQGGERRFVFRGVAE